MALQTSPAPPGIPPDAFAVDAPSSRRNYSHQTPEDLRSTSSPRASSRLPSRRPSGNASQPGTPQQSLQRSPNPTLASSGSTARPQTSQPSPRTPTAAPSSSQQTRREQAGAYETQGGPPIAPPPRTSSSNQRSSSVAKPSDSNIPDRTRHRGDDQRAYEREGPTGEETANNSHSTARERRAVTVSPGGVQRSTSTKERSQKSPLPAQGLSSSRSQARPEEMTRENSEVINRVVVTDPQVDIAREQERLAEAVPAGSHGASETGNESSRPTPRSRQDFSASAARRKETKFGEYILGQTLGEGEFGKVKLGWKKDGSVEVAIKLIRRENLNTNPSRLPKIYREISILRGLSHANIVRLHEMVETERHIGIILEYASGGELFDYILTHRYLKDGAARRLFAQLVSGVGYLHKKGIVHRDLKLENLLLDRNRNIIITDFGFANTFDPRDSLGEDIEYNLTNRDFVKKMDLERITNGFRRGDLMQTSCGSPCYAAPELVVTDSLYTGRKVDVWSCGVILYAMLAGYLPFDDDPANPEGDNINLLYKYIVSTPLTFPEYVSPHARDLLRRILVADPRKRADLFEVARHSWLADYAHVVAHVTSTTTTIGDITNSTAAQEQPEAPLLNRSASVREPKTPHSSNMSPVGGLQHQGKLDEGEKSKPPRDGKRRTVQVEYVAPQSQTTRGELSPPPPRPASSSRTPETDARISAAKQPDVPRKQSSTGVPTRKPLPQDPPNLEDARKVAATSSRQRQPGPQSGMEAPVRPSREPPRSVSDSVGAFGQLSQAVPRPTTGGSMSSAGGGRLPSRGNSYSQPLAPTVAVMNAQGRLAQPKGARAYNISAPIPQAEPYISDAAANRPASQRVPQKPTSLPSAPAGRGHKRANTFGQIFSKSGSLFGGKSPVSTPVEPTGPEKKYPPTSMKNPIGTESPRQSTESRRPSFAFSRKNSDLSRKEGRPRRFSLLPASFSLKGMGGGSKDSDSAQYSQDKRPSMSQHSNSQSMAPPRVSQESQVYDGGMDQNRHVSAPHSQMKPPRSAPQPSHSRYASAQYPSSGSAGQGYSHGESAPAASDLSFQQPQQSQQRPLYPQGFNDFDNEAQPRSSMHSPRGTRVLQKPNRKFEHAWEQEDNGQHAGSSGAARRVMDFFRRRGKARSGDDR